MTNNEELFQCMRYDPLGTKGYEKLQAVIQSGVSHCSPQCVLRLPGQSLWGAPVTASLREVECLPNANTLACRPDGQGVSFLNREDRISMQAAERLRLPADLRLQQATAAATELLNPISLY